jgi:TM2 domain-containing membrane protein YozV
MQLSTLRALLGEYPNTKKVWKKLTVLLIIFVLLLSSEPFFYKYIIQAFQDSWSIWILSGIIILWILASIATIGVRYIYGINLLNNATEDTFYFLLK